MALWGWWRVLQKNMHKALTWTSWVQSAFIWFVTRTERQTLQAALYNFCLNAVPLLYGQVYFPPYTIIVNYYYVASQDCLPKFHVQLHNYGYQLMGQEDNASFVFNFIQLCNLLSSCDNTSYTDGLSFSLLIRYNIVNQSVNPALFTWAC